MEPGSGKAGPPRVDLKALEDTAKSYLRVAENRDELTSRQVRAKVANLMGIDQAALEDPAVKVNVKKVIENVFLDVQDEDARSGCASAKRKRSRVSAQTHKAAVENEGETNEGEAGRSKVKQVKKGTRGGIDEVVDGRKFVAARQHGRPKTAKKVEVHSDSDSDFAALPTPASIRKLAGGTGLLSKNKEVPTKTTDQQAEPQGNENTPDDSVGESSDFMSPQPAVAHSAAKAKREKSGQKAALKGKDTVGETGGHDDGVGEVGEEASPHKRKKEGLALKEAKKARKPSSAEPKKSKKGKGKTTNIPPAVPGKELDLSQADAEKIHSLKKFITACGVRKRWGKELGELNLGSEIIARLKKMLQDLGVEGRPSLAQCQRIKRQRELQAELSAMDVRNILENVAEAKLQRRTKASSWLYPAAKTKVKKRMGSYGSDDDDNASEGEHSLEMAEVTTSSEADVANSTMESNCDPDRKAGV